MFALLYLALAIFLGDQLCRRFLRYVSVVQRCATAVISGVLFSTWFTYSAAWLFKGTKSPLLWGDVCFFAVGLCFVWLIRRRSRRGLGVSGEFVRQRVP